jgi:hypothetical protein
MCAVRVCTICVWKGERNERDSNFDQTLSASPSDSTMWLDRAQSRLRLGPVGLFHLAVEIPWKKWRLVKRNISLSLQKRRDKNYQLAAVSSLSTKLAIIIRFTSTSSSLWISMFIRHVLFLLSALQSVQPHGLQTSKFYFSCSRLNSVMFCVDIHW